MPKSITDETFSLLTIDELRRILKDDDIGLLFCFGTSFISQIIQAKTRLYNGEVVPSHVAMIINDFIYESTTDEIDIGKKHIPSGVRRWLLSDFIKSEKKRNTLYYFSNAVEVHKDIAEQHIHRPYGKDTIIDYLLTDKSKGKSNGLICSQYVNLCTGLIGQSCVTPAELYREIKRIEDK